MKTRCHTVLAFVLSLTVILTGQGVAASRSVDHVAGQMVLCTGAGPVVVYVDKDGQPTQAPHYCPDYAPTLLGAIFTAHPELPTAPNGARDFVPSHAQNLIVARVLCSLARAPPVFV